MSKKKKKSVASGVQEQAKDATPDAQSVQRVDGIPYRDANRPVWKYVAIGAVFVAWVAFLIYCQTAGAIK